MKVKILGKVEVVLSAFCLIHPNSLSIYEISSNTPIVTRATRPTVRGEPATMTQKLEVSKNWMEYHWIRPDTELGYHKLPLLSLTNRRMKSIENYGRFDLDE